MRLIRGLNSLPMYPQGSVVTIGAFDGIHLGHQAIMDQVIDSARELRLPSVVICFEPLPREYFAPEDAPLRIMSFYDKFRVLSKLGIDAVLRIPFNEKIASLSAEDFFETVFIRGLHLRHLVIGDDFRFGHNREGGKKMLLEEQTKHDFTFSDANSVLLGGSRVSSTQIRKYLEAGNFSEAAALLGRPFRISGKVSSDKPHKKSALPSINVYVKRHRAAINGTYITRIFLEGRNEEQCYPAVAYVGQAPTPEGKHSHTVIMINLLDSSVGLERQRLQIEFLHQLAPLRKLSSSREINATMLEDLNNCKSWLDEQNIVGCTTVK